MSPLVTTGIIVAAVGYVIIRRFSGEPLTARDLGSAPLILTGIGIYSVIKADGLEFGDYAWAAAGVFIAVICGAWRGTTVTLFTKNGALWQRYSKWTLVVWFLSLVISGGFALLASVAGMHDEARPMILSIGVGMLGEALTLGLRALSTGKPFSPEEGKEAASRQQLKEQLGRFAPQRASAASQYDGELKRSPSLKDGVRWLAENNGRSS